MLLLPGWPTMGLNRIYKKRTENHWYLFRYVDSLCCSSYCYTSWPSSARCVCVIRWMRWERWRRYCVATRHWTTWHRRHEPFCRTATRSLRCSLISTKWISPASRSEQFNFSSTLLTLWSIKWGITWWQPAIAKFRYRKCRFCHVMYRLMYPNIWVRTVPPVSVTVRTRVSFSFSFMV